VLLSHFLCRKDYSAVGPRGGLRRALHPLNARRGEEDFISQASWRTMRSMRKRQKRAKEVSARENPRRLAPEATLADLRARARAGLPMGRHSVRNLGLYDRAVRDFGTWTAALARAGLLPQRLVHAPRRQNVPARQLSERLLRSGFPNRTLVKMTGLRA